MVKTITFEDFLKVEMRVGKIIKVEGFPETQKPAYKLTIDFGKLGIKKSSAQITKRYTKEQLLGRQVVAVVNFPPKQIDNFVSEVLVLGAVTGNNDVILLKPDEDVELGDRIA
jgi:tRNA-binding protein